MEIVKYHNDINKIKLGNFTERELDIFFSLIFKLKNQTTDTIILEFSELKHLSEAKERSNSRLIESVENISEKLVKLNQKLVLPNGNILLFNLFRTLLIDLENSQLKVSVNSDFQYMLNDLIGNFTMFELKTLTNLKSSYSKNVFRLLKQWQGTCNFIIDLNEFKEILGVPETYKTKDFNQWILNPIKKELTPIFNNLKITKLTKEKQPIRQGQKAIYISFTWNKIEKIASKSKKEIKEIEPLKIKKSATWVEKEDEFKKIQGKISLKLIKSGINPISNEFRELNACNDLDDLNKFIEKYSINL